MVTRLLVWAAMALAAYGGITVLAYVYAEGVLFQPPPASYARGQVDFTSVPVDDADSIAVQHVANPGARYTVLFSHGNAEDLGHLQPLLRLIVDAGFAVLAYDYRGYGRSAAARPTERRTIEDAEAVYRYATRELGIPAGRIILHGRSVGAGPSLAVAESHPVAAVVLESTFTSAYRVMTRWPLLPFDRFRNLARVRDLDVPVLVIHGERDRIIGVGHGRALFAAARGPKRAFWVEGAGHNDLAMVAGEEYVGELRAFGGVVDGS